MPGLLTIEKDGVKHTLVVAVSLCLVCSVIVSAAAVLLRPLQVANKHVDKQKNILAVVDLLEPGADVQALFDRYVEPRVVDLNTGEFVEHLDPRTYDQRQAARDPAQSLTLSAPEDVADIKRRAKHATVYLVRQDGELKYLVLPVRGYGLWSTLYGFVALKADLNTVYGLSFYEHAETPGLGGEVDNPDWKSQWRGKKVFADDGDKTPDLRVIKGDVDPSAPQAEYKVDGIAGATLTSRGVSNMVRFWFGELGYRPLLENLKAKQSQANRELAGEARPTERRG